MEIKAQRQPFLWVYYTTNFDLTVALALRQYSSLRSGYKNRYRGNRGKWAKIGSKTIDETKHLSVQNGTNRDDTLKAPTSGLVLTTEGHTKGGTPLTSFTAMMREAKGVPAVPSRLPRSPTRS
jgi:hypothetical protein